MNTRQLVKADDSHLVCCWHGELVPEVMHTFTFSLATRNKGLCLTSITLPSHSFSHSYLPLSLCIAMRQFHTIFCNCWNNAHVRLDHWTFNSSFRPDNWNKHSYLSVNSFVVDWLGVYQTCQQRFAVQCDNLHIKNIKKIIRTWHTYDRTTFETRQRGLLTDSTDRWTFTKCQHSDAWRWVHMPVHVLYLEFLVPFLTKSQRSKQK